jgi:hypothetical protein
MNIVILEASKCTYNLTYQEVTQSLLIKDMLEDTDGYQTQYIPLGKEIPPSVMTAVVEFLRFHARNRILFFALPLLSTTLSDYMLPWDQTWVTKLSTDGLITDVMNVADYLDIPDMLRICMCYVAIQCKL